MIVRTFDGLQALTDDLDVTTTSSAGLSLYNAHRAYEDIYREHPNVRICVEFLARNIADIAPQVFRRVSDTDRVRLVDHPLARWLDRPNPATTRYRLFEDLMTDWGIYQQAYWLKVRYIDDDGELAIGLVRLPPAEITVEGGLIPSGFVWTTEGGRVREKWFPPSEIVHFNGYKLGISPLETLRGVLAEEEAAGEHREGYWRNSARHEGIVSRPADKKRYTAEQAAEWRKQWQENYGGGAGAGRTMLLQDGEEWTATSFSARDSEYTAGGKLRREICAAVYQIPQPFVGILEHATFSNIKEQHKNLYQDCLGPTFEMLRQELKRQLLIECADQEGVYLEFNIDKKLAGTPEERANAMSVSIGRPWRTVNEGRALDNLPRIDDAALDTVAPQQGGPSDATAQPQPTAPMMTRPGDRATVAADLVVQHRTRQLARLQKFPAAQRADQFYAVVYRATRELAEDLAAAGVDAAVDVATSANADLLSRLLLEAVA